MKKIALASLLLLISAPAYAGSIQFNTYYPSPIGAYDRLRLVPRDPTGMVCNATTIGTFFVSNADDAIYYCDGTSYSPFAGGGGGYWGRDTTNGYLYPTTLTDWVGIGTATPTSMLEVNGSIRDTGNFSFYPVANSGALMWNSYNDGTGDKYLTNDSAFEIYHDFTSDTLRLSGKSGGVADSLVGFTEDYFVVTTAGNIGMGTLTPRTRLELGNDGAILAIGTHGSGWIEPSLGAGTRLLWYPRKAAFRVGQVEGTEWDDVNIGDGSIAMGFHSRATGVDSFAVGYWTHASGAHAVALGKSTTASGAESTAIGYSAYASGAESTAMGGGSLASGDGATAIGRGVTAQAYDSFATGQFNVVAGDKVSWIATDPLFVIGNGSDTATRSNVLTVLKNSNVGIGTSAPIANLEIDNATTVFAQTGNDPHGSLHLVGPTPYFSVSDTNATDPTDDWRLGGWNDDFVISHDDNSANTDSDDLFIQRSTGNIEIGDMTVTPNPTARLQVVQVNAADAFRVDDVQGDTSPFLIDQNGNVGVGTETPTKKVEITGTLGFTGGTGPMCIFMNVCPTGWVDKGQGGYIYNVGAGATCPYSPGAAFVTGQWNWCHPEICCNE